jgi:hypothetical protein
MSGVSSQDLRKFQSYDFIVNYRKYSKSYIMDQFQKIDLYNQENIELLWVYSNILEALGEISEHKKQVEIIIKNENNPEYFRDIDLPPFSVPVDKLVFSTLFNH